jgi:hypothetical protein
LRASTITDVSLLNRGARIAAIALTTAIGSLAVTAGASGESGYTSVDAIVAASDSSAEPDQLPTPDTYLARLGSEDKTVGNGLTPDTYLAQLGSRGNNTDALASAISEPAPGQTAAVAVSQPDPSDGFDWLSAAVGAFAAIAVVGLGGAAFVTFRRRVAMSPSPASTS